MSFITARACLAAPRRLGWGGLALIAAFGGVAEGLAGQDVEATALRPFFEAPTPALRREEAARIAAAGVPFDQLLAELRQGPEHRGSVPRGALEPTVVGEDGHLHRYTLLIPQAYDPAVAWPVRVYLHGATHYPARAPGGSWWPELDLVTGEDHISVLPMAWEGCLWWEYGQVEALSHILASVKRVFNVDENRVSLLGVSDGGAGVYFSATHNPTPWAAFVPMIGNPRVLENVDYHPDGRTHAANLLMRSLFVVNTRDDTTHPPAIIHPYIERYQAMGVDLDFHEYAGEHDLSWWGAASPGMEAFLADHVRDPYPDTLRWVTDRSDRYNRVHWLVVDELGSSKGPKRAEALSRIGHDGRVSAVWATRSGNTFDLETHRARRIRVLISPDEIDLDQPVRVTVNGVVRFEGPVTPDPDVLMRWAAVDFDRTMLYAAEILIDIPR
jgi:hypothetical protein